MHPWLRWLWPTPAADDTEMERIRAARADAERRLAEARARWPAVNQAAHRAARRIDQNHIGQLIEEAVRARPGDR